MTSNPSASHEPPADGGNELWRDEATGVTVQWVKDVGYTAEAPLGKDPETGLMEVSTRVYAGADQALRAGRRMAAAREREMQETAGEAQGEDAPGSKPAPGQGRPAG